MSCSSCWPWCKSPPQPTAHSAPARNYVESKSVVRPVTVDVVPPPALVRHDRVLSTMFIKDGKAVVSFREMSEEEANQRFGRAPAKTDKRATVRFDRTTAPLSPTVTQAT